MENFKCECIFCTTHELEKWATVMECGCGCHQNGFTAHDGLCCSVPNVLKVDNPHTDLKPKKFYRDQLDKMNRGIDSVFEK